MDKSIPYEIIVVFSIQRAVFLTEGFGTHKCVPYEIIVVFPIHRAVFLTEGFGTHKCVPYENDRALSYISYLDPINAS